MKIPVIRNLVKSYSLEELRSAEEALLNESAPAIEIGGEDEGEQLTHVIGAIEIKNHIEKGMSDAEALRAFTQRVRKSIG